MKIRILTVGKPDDRNYKTLREMYLKRIQHYVPVETDFIRPEKITSLSVNQILNAEAERLLNKLDTKHYNIVLDKTGETFSSESFAGFFEHQLNFGQKNMTFIIGGALGLSPKIIQAAHKKISFSQMTFAHDLALIILLEQIYRAHTIIRGEKYHK
ncbi:23S rRNA (pseudouridine(1915)-N(3))-methyltransferase RlmH [candidate division KSB1 bacterium]|nr:23S rRNA (pseudouridine(1915)-N(3))-methyltransferase RlmH [candidate division KSB1 bacterium]